MSDTNCPTAEILALPDRRTQVAFDRLCTLLERRNAEVLADPLKYLAEASEQIIRRQVFIDRLQEAMWAPVRWRESDASRPIGSVSISRDEYDRWKAVEKLIREHP